MLLEALARWVPETNGDSLNADGDTDSATAAGPGAYEVRVSGMLVAAQRLRHLHHLCNASRVDADADTSSNTGTDGVLEVEMRGLAVWLLSQQPTWKAPHKDPGVHTPWSALEGCVHILHPVWENHF